MPPLDFDHAWPYLGLALAALFLARRGFRPRSLAWLTAAQLPAYAVHQFEEHGVDLIGRRYAFLPFFHEAAARLGLGGSPADPTWVTGVNVGAVWLWGLQAALCGTEEPAVALGMAGLVASNALVHAIPFLRGEGYNPGLATAVLLFLPLSIAMFGRYVRSGRASRAQAWGALASGFGCHAVLLGSVKLMQKGFWSTRGAAAFFYVYGLVGPWVLKFLLRG